MSPADAAPPPDTDVASPARSRLEEAVVDALDDVEDPHIPASLVELEMVVDVEVVDGAAQVELTYPCLGCPAYGMIQDDVREAATSVAGVGAAEVEVVWDPVWSKDALDDEVREKVRRWGVGL